MLTVFSRRTNTGPKPLAGRLYASRPGESVGRPASMKLEGLDHPKTLHLASLLGASIPCAIGHLELLWAFTAKRSPQGNIGKWPDGAIAQACYWTGDVATFIGALREAGFIKDHPTHRLIVHDWQDHAAGWVRAKLKKAGLGFICTSEPTSDRTSEPTPVPTSEPSILYQYQAKPSQVQNAREQFLDFRRAYPAGTYADVAWQGAEREFYRLTDDTPPAELIAAADAYRTQQQAMGKVGTQYVRSPAKFLADGHWRGPFPAPLTAEGQAKADREKRERESLQRQVDRARDLGCPLTVREHESAASFESRIDTWKANQPRQSGAPKPIAALMPAKVTA